MRSAQGTDFLRSLSERRKMLRVSIREFDRKMYQYLKQLPIIVYNKRSRKDLFKVERIL
jgi:hypothetical protein